MVRGEVEGNDKKRKGTEMGRKGTGRKGRDWQGAGTGREVKGRERAGRAG